MVGNCLLNPLCFIIIAFQVNLYNLVSFKPSGTGTFKLFLLYFLIPVSVTIISYVSNRNPIDFVCLMLILTFTVISSTRCTSTPNTVSRDDDIFNGSVFCLNMCSTNYANNRY